MTDRQPRQRRTVAWILEDLRAQRQQLEAQADTHRQQLARLEAERDILQRLIDAYDGDTATEDAVSHARCEDDA